MTSLPIFTRAENKSLYWLQMAQQSKMSDEYRRETERMVRLHENGSSHETLAENMCTFMCQFARQQIQSTGLALGEVLGRREQSLSSEDRYSMVQKFAQWQKQHQSWTKEMYDIEVRTIAHLRWPGRSEHHDRIDAAVVEAIAELIAAHGSQEDRATRDASSRASLTDKQLEALQVVGQHHGNFAAAARTLQKDRKTVEEHYRTALKKLSSANESGANGAASSHTTPAAYQTPQVMAASFAMY
jgi:phage gp16-like protein